MVRTLLVGIGGPTCSGKTTLVKHLISLLPSTPAGSRPFIIHQDDFAPPESSLIWNDEVGSADWDDPDTSVDWSRLQSFLIHVKASGKLPKGHTSHDELNALPELPIAEEISAQCRQMLREVLQHDGLEEDVQIVLLDGFLLYYDRKVRSMIDVSVFLRIGRDMLADRRRKRGGYVTAEGVTWNVSPAAKISDGRSLEPLLLTALCFAFRTRLSTLIASCGRRTLRPTRISLLPGMSKLASFLHPLLKRSPFV